MTKYRNILTYIALSFSIPLVCIVLMKLCPIFQAGAGNLILFGIEGASPTLAVLIIWMINGKWNGFKNNCKSKYIDHFSYRYCLIAIIAQVILLTISRCIVFFLGQEHMFLYPVTAKKLLIISLALVAEELGWRGFLQDELEKLLPERFIPFCVGVLWALWHYHFIISGSMDIPLVAFTLGCIFESCGYFCITKLAKGNIIPTCLWHFSGNLFFNLYRFDASWHHGDTRAYWISTGVYFLNVVWFLIFLQSKRKHS